MVDATGGKAANATQESLNEAWLELVDRAGAGRKSAGIKAVNDAMEETPAFTFKAFNLHPARKGEFSFEWTVCFLFWSSECSVEAAYSTHLMRTSWGKPTLLGH